MSTKVYPIHPMPFKIVLEQLKELEMKVNLI
jgi:hypothetical protein